MGQIVKKLNISGKNVPHSDTYMICLSSEDVTDLQEVLCEGYLQKVKVIVCLLRLTLCSQRYE
jgi:hypothetical protein